MRFIKLSTASEAEDLLFSKISEATSSHNNVVWLTSGGSNIELTVAVFNRLDQSAIDKLTIMPIDERYGSPGHPNSNYAQLQKAGLDFSRVKNYSVLYEGEPDLASTAEHYADILQKVLNESDYSIGQIGIGPDGHTVGILPHSLHAKLENNLVVSYVGPDYERISMSLSGLSKLSEVLVFALGENKHLAITNLKDKEISLEEQPSQIFKQLAQAYIINDMIGDN